MKKFDVEITETLQRTVSVEAVSQEEAEKIVTEAWNNEDYVLDSTDFVSVDFKTVGEQELSENRKMEILLVQPGMYPQKVTIGTELKDFQDAVGGTIAASYTSYVFYVHPDEIEAITREFAAIGNNLNQIAAFFNSGGIQSRAMLENINHAISCIFEMREQVAEMAGKNYGNLKAHRK